MKNFKEFYCESSDYTSDCLLYPAISIKESSALKLSYLRFYNQPTDKIAKKVFVKDSIYKTLQVSYNSFSEEDFNYVLAIIKKIYNHLPNDKKDFLLDKVNIFLNSKGIEIDLYVGILLQDGITFFNSSDKETMDYIKFITRL